MNKYDSPLVNAARKINEEYRNGNYDPLPYDNLPLDTSPDEHLPMNIDDYMYLYDIINNLNYEFFYEFPQLTEIKRLCEDHIDARCHGGE